MSSAQVDSAIQRLHANKREWAHADLAIGTFPKGNRRTNIEQRSYICCVNVFRKNKCSQLHQHTFCIGASFRYQRIRGIERRIIQNSILDFLCEWRKWENEPKKWNKKYNISFRAYWIEIVCMSNLYCFRISIYYQILFYTINSRSIMSPQMLQHSHINMHIEMQIM